jgi:large subunit ribosomal protein L35
MKSHKGIKKRVKVTSNNKIMALGSGKERKLNKKSTARKNRLKTYREISEDKKKQLKRMLNI